MPCFAVLRIDWSKVQRQEDVARYAYKSNWAAHVIMEHYAPEPSRKLFVIYGEGHVNRRGTLTAEARQKVSLDQWFMVGLIRERGADGALIARMGDPAQAILRVRPGSSRSRPIPGISRSLGSSPWQP